MAMKLAGVNALLELRAAHVHAGRAVIGHRCVAVFALDDVSARRAVNEIRIPPTIQQQNRLLPRLDGRPQQVLQPLGNQVNALAKAPIHVMREWITQGVPKQLWDERRYFSVGLFLARVAEKPRSYGVRSTWDIYRKTTPVMAVALTTYRRGVPYALTFQEMAELIQ